jgi:hypothetical protein
VKILIYCGVETHNFNEVDKGNVRHLASFCPMLNNKAALCSSFSTKDLEFLSSTSTPKLITYKAIDLYQFLPSKILPQQRTLELPAIESVTAAVKLNKFTNSSVTSKQNKQWQLFDRRPGAGLNPATSSRSSSGVRNHSKLP